VRFLVTAINLTNHYEDHDDLKKRKVDAPLYCFIFHFLVLFVVSFLMTDINRLKHHGIETKRNAGIFQN